MRPKRTLAGGAVALGLAAAFLLVASDAGLSRISALPGPVGATALAALVRRGEESGTRRAIALLGDGSAAPRARASAGGALGARAAPAALPALLVALNGGPPKVAAACSRALRGFEASGRSFEEGDPPAQCAAVVREWNEWWRDRGAALARRSGTGRGLAVRPGSPQ